MIEYPEIQLSKLARLLILLSLAVWMVGSTTATTATTDSDSHTFPQKTLSDIIPPEYQMRFVHISTADGLSHGMVLRIVQDDLGFMWFGTADGLNRYDGHTFKVYKNDPDDPGSIQSDSIWALYVDRSGTLWVGTEGGGLNRFDRDADRFIHYLHDPDDPTSLSDDGVTVIYEDRSGILWVGTATGGLNRFDRETERFTHYRYDPNDPDSISSDGIISIFEDREGVLWIGTSIGLNRFDRETGRFTRYQHDPADPYSLSHNSVWVIHEDRTGALWVGTAGGGLSRFDRETERFTHYRFAPYDPYSLSNDIVFALYEEPSGDFLVGTYGGGINRFDPQTGQCIQYTKNENDPYSLSSDHIRTIYVDRSGVLWVGTEGGGVNRSDPPYKRFLHYRAIPDDPNSLSDNFVTTLYEDRAGTLWIGTLDGGLNRLDRETGEFTHYHHDPTDPSSLSDDNVTAVYEDHFGVLWVATGNGGLNRLDRATGRFEHYREDPTDPASLSTDALYAIYEDRRGVLWIGTNGGGLERFDRETETFVHYRYAPDDDHSLSHDRVNVIFEDRAGNLWIGTSGGGLNSFDREADHFIRYQAARDDPTSLSNNVVFVVQQDLAGTLWIGTANGLDRFDPKTRTFDHYREKDGLPNDAVCGILVDDTGDLWISTARGLARFDPQTETFRSYDAGDGLQGGQFHPGAYYKGWDGTLFFGGVNGFNAFRPEDIRDNPVVPPIVLTRLLQGGNDIPLDQAVETVEQISLRWPYNFFEFEFAALNYVQSEKNQYAYMLEGFDREWNYVGGRQFGQYTNLPGGTYTLRIKGTNNDGVWNEEGVALRVEVIPPIWQTWWFIGLSLFLAVAGIGSAVWWRWHSTNLQRQWLESKIAERTTELAMLNQLTQQLTATLDMRQVMERLLSAATDVLDVQGASLWLREEPESDYLVCQAVVQRDNGMSPLNLRVRVNQGIAGWVVRSGQSLYINNVSTDPRFSTMVDEQIGFTTRSILAAPLRVRDTIIGVLEVVNKQSGDFNADDQSLVETLASSAAIAIDNARLVDTLQQNARMLKARNEDLDAFAHTVAHDLKNPLTGVIGMAEVLREDYETVSKSDLLKCADHIARTGRKMNAIINNLLMVASVSRLQEADIGPLDMAAIVQEALTRLEKLIVERQAEICRPEIWPTALGHPTLIEEVWVNYISNAIKYGGSPPHLELGATELEEGWVRFWVQDNGPGVPPEELERLFTPFTRLQLTSSYAQGYGLGLSIVRSIVEKLGGQVGVESFPNRGSTFFFTLPSL